MGLNLGARKWGRLGVALGLGIVLAGCGAAAPAEPSDGTAQGGSGLFRVDDAAAGAPVAGGVMSYASYANVTTLDPAAGNPFGTTGGTEMSSIYDLLVRYDFDSREFVPQLAESIEPDADQLVWTMRLRPGVTFSDGSPLNADAVKWSIDRYNEKRGIGSDLWLSGVASTEAVDDQTVVFTLNAPWPGFEALLALGHGMVVSKSSVGADAFTPIGAGAFTLDRFEAHEELVVNARADYWGGAPYLDTVRFVGLNGEQAKLEALQADGVDAIFVRNPEVVQRAVDAGFGGYVETSALGSLIQINNREGRPGSDVRIRQAIAHAVESESINTRVWGGVGLPGAEVFQESSQWHNDVEPLEHSQDQARELLAAAKADGYDGKISYLATQEPNNQNQALAIQAMLQAVGFDVQIDYVSSATDFTRKIGVERDFDIAGGAWSLMDPAPFMRLQNNLRTGAGNNNSGFANPDMDVLLDQLKGAASEDDTRAVIEDLQTLVNETVPFVALGTTKSLIAWQSDLHGVLPSLDGILLLDQAWTTK